MLSKLKEKPAYLGGAFISALIASGILYKKLLNK